MQLPDQKIGDRLVVRPPFGFAHDAGYQIYSRYGFRDRFAASPYRPWWLYLANATTNEREGVIQDVVATDHQIAAQVDFTVAEELVSSDDQTDASNVAVSEDVAAQVDFTVGVSSGDQTDASNVAVSEDVAAQVDFTVAEELVSSDDQTDASNVAFSEDVAAETQIERAGSEIIIAAENQIESAVYVSVGEEVFATSGIHIEDVAVSQSEDVIEVVQVAVEELVSSDDQTDASNLAGSEDAAAETQIERASSESIIAAENQIQAALYVSVVEEVFATSGVVILKMSLQVKLTMSSR